MVVYGHTPVPEPEWLNRTINIDTGCVFGGKLDGSAVLRKSNWFPFLLETNLLRRIAQAVFASRNQSELRSCLLQQQHDDLLDLADVTGKRIVTTRLHGNVTIREENATAASGSDEPVRRESKVAGLLAAHDVRAPANTHAPVFWSIPPKPLHIFAMLVCRVSSAKKNTWDRVP